MKKANKFMSLVLSVAMMVSVLASFSLTPAFAAETTSEESVHAEALSVLKALSIVVGDAETGLIRPNDAIKRSEVAKMAVAILGLTDIATGSGGASKYSDVPDNHWASGYINVATNQGIVIGDDVGTFRPDDTITYQEAITIIVRILGYEPKALDDGGYPGGYMVVASDNKLNKNTTVSDGTTPVTRGIVAQVFYNALEVKMMEKVGFGSNAEYIIGEKTLLKNKLNAEKISGQVSATSQSALNGTSSLNRDEVKIDKEIYKLANGVDVTTLLGYNVNAYLQEDDYDDKYVILISPVASKNTELEISAENLEEITASQISYWKDKENDKKATTVNLDDTKTMIYNGQAEAFDAEIADIADKAGYVRLLDTDRNGKFDIIFVTEFKNTVVKEVMLSSGKIIDMYGGSTLTLDPEDEDLDYIIVKNGEAIKLEQLKKWDVLSVSESRDKSIYRVYVSNEVVEGKVKGISGNNELDINGKLYEIAQNYPNDIRLSDEGKFYLDIEGKIAAVDATSTLSSNYAYLMNAAIPSAIDSNLQLRMFTKSGETVTLRATEKIRFNSKSSMKAEEVLEKLKDKDGKIINQLITFETNSDGNIVSISTATDNTASGAINEDHFTHNLTLEDAIYKKATGKLGKVNISDKTIIFDIPENWTDSSDFAIRTIDMFEDDTPYDALVFDMSKDYTAGALIVTSTDYQANAASDAAIVTNIVSASNDDDVVVDKIYLTQGGESKTLLATESGILTKDDGKTPLQKGDIIQYNTNANGEITTYRVLFDISKKDTEFTKDITDDLTVIYGKVSEKFSSSMNITVNDENEQNISFGSAKMYLVDASKSNRIVVSATSGDIQKYDDADPYKVFVKSYKGVVSEIIIIKL